jgi:hypothetical protein
LMWKRCVWACLFPGGARGSRPRRAFFSFPQLKEHVLGKGAAKSAVPGYLLPGVGSYSCAKPPRKPLELAFTGRCLLTIGGYYFLPGTIKGNQPSASTYLMGGAVVCRPSKAEGEEDEEHGLLVLGAIVAAKSSGSPIKEGEVLFLVMPAMCESPDSGSEVGNEQLFEHHLSTAARHVSASSFLCQCAPRSLSCPAPR